MLRTSDSWTLVFLLLVTEAEADMLLPVLSRVVRRLRDREVLKHLRAGSSAEASLCSAGDRLPAQPATKRLASRPKQLV